MADFGRKQPAPQPLASTTRPVDNQKKAPKTGFSEAPKSSSECCNTEVGPGVGNTRRGIH